MSVLQESGDPWAIAAVVRFLHTMTKSVAVYAVVSSWLNALVFTASIGENFVPLLAALCRNLAWFGATLDKHASAAGGLRIFAPDSAASVWVILPRKNR